MLVHIHACFYILHPSFQLCISTFICEAMSIKTKYYFTRLSRDNPRW